MPFSVADLKPAGGSFYAFLHENQGTGLPRSLYWNLGVEFAPVLVDGEPWSCNVLCEWLTWPVRRWTELDGKGVEHLLQPDLAEASLYLGWHQPLELESIRLRRLSGPAFELTVGLRGDLEGPEGEVLTEARLEATSTVSFEGAVVVPGNLLPTPQSGEEAAGLLAAFAQLDELEAPIWDRFRYVFKPSSTCFSRATD